MCVDMAEMERYWDQHMLQESMKEAKQEEGFSHEYAKQAQGE